MTQAELEVRVAHWQERLRLQDWDVTICTRRHWELKEVCAQVTLVLNKKAALISILDPNDYQPDEFSVDGIERAIVHELLHLHLEPLAPEDREGLQWTALEQAINAISHALVPGLLGHTISRDKLQGFEKKRCDS